MKILTFGVLGETQFTYVGIVEGKRAWVATEDSIHTMKHIGDIYELAVKHGVERVWIHTTIDTWEELPKEFFTNEHYHTGDTQEYAYLEVYRIGSEAYSEAVGMHFTAHPHTTYPIRNFKHGAFTDELQYTDREVAVAVTYLETLLDTPITYSDTSVGTQLIKRTNSGYRKEYLQPCEADMSLFVQATGASKPWYRLLTDEEKGMKYLHLLDKNADFLAASNIQLGIGTYERVTSPSFSKYDVGLWHVTVKGHSPYEGQDMPLACDVLAMPEKTGWMYTATAQLLLDMGYSLDFHEVLIWDKKHRSNVLEPWLKVFSNAYTELRVNTDKYKNERARMLAKDMLKGMYVKALSVYASDKQDKRGSYLYRPDWYHLVIAEATQRMIRNIMTYEKIGMKPVLWNKDAIIYISDEKDITKILPNLRMELKPAHFKHRMFLLEKCKHLFTENTSPVAIETQLKNIVKEGVETYA